MRIVRSGVVACKMVALAIMVLTSGVSPAVAQGGGPLVPDDPALLAMRANNARIQLANYPRDALRRGEQGVVGINVTVDRQGRLRECAVSESSGFASLDDATCDFLFQHVKVQSYLAPGGGGTVTRQQGQVVWQLPVGATPAAAMPVSVAATPPAAAKKICRVQVKTGSLIASQRICLTKAEWHLQYLRAQEETQEMHPKFQTAN